MKSTSSNAPASIATKLATKKGQERKAIEDEVVLGQEVIERLKSWCYV